MDWYYAVDGEQKGPVPDSEFQQLLSQGVIGQESLVWRAGMPDWQRYGQIFGGMSRTACAECGGILPETDMIRFGDQYICPNCKPVFVQKIREGLAVGREVRYAGFWIRLGALIIDGIILSLIQGAVSALMIFSVQNNAIAPFWILNTFQFVFSMAYVTFFIGRFGATPGKMACQIRVVTADGGKVGYGRAFCRGLASILSYIIFMIGYIMAAFDSQKRALHDYMCGTRVIRKQALMNEIDASRPFQKKPLVEPDRGGCRLLTGISIA